MVEKIPKSVPGWTKPIIVGRHAFGDQYRSTDIVVDKPGKLELVYTPTDGSGEKRLEVFNFPGAGVGLAMYNTIQSIRDFAHASFKMALQKRVPMVSEERISPGLLQEALRCSYIMCPVLTSNL